MTSSATQIEKLDLRKASGEIELAVPVEGRIENIVSDLDIRYSPSEDGGKGEPDNSLKVLLRCIPHTEDDADSAMTGQLKATVEIIYQVHLSSKFDPNDIDDIMHAVWPYLRSAAVHQLQLIDLTEVGFNLPYDLSAS